MEALPRPRIPALRVPVRTHQKHVPLKVNVGESERLLSLATGAGLLLASAGTRSLGRASLLLTGGMLAFRGVTGYCPVYGLLGLNSSREGVHSTSVSYERGAKIDQSITVNKLPEEVYRFWRRLDNLPRFMRHLESVTQIRDRRSHWVAIGPGGRRFEWDAEIINEIEGELIGWRSLGDSDVDHAGSVHFEPAPGGGTRVRVVIRFDPPAGAFGAAIAKLFGEAPDQQLAEDLARFKEMLEQETPTV